MRASRNTEWRRMPDVVSPIVRSRMMAGIRAKDTKPERVIRSLLHNHGFRFRANVSSLPGKPDVVLSKWRTVVFVHGCFWHGHDCPLFRLPKSRRVFWLRKIGRNREVDLRNINDLRALGWRVIIVWECMLKGRSAMTAARIAKWLERAVRIARRAVSELPYRGGQ